MRDTPYDIPSALWLLLPIFLVLVLLLAGCGGGGGGASEPPPDNTPIVYRSDLLIGYYGGGEHITEHADHVNQVWLMGWGGDYLPSVATQFARATGLGVTNVVLHFPQAYQGTAQMREAFTALRAMGVLSHVGVLYPVDEPEVQGYTDARVKEVNATLRGVMAEFPELANTKLAVIYTRDRKWPGIETYDWVGFDDYNAGASVLFNETWQDLRNRLRPDQRVLLVPGGADPWRQDPAAFERVAHTDPKVVGIVPFIWQDFADRGVGKGVRSNGMLPAYCAMGRRIKNPGVPEPRC